MDVNAFLSSKKVVLLDGAMGTELQRRGYRTKLPLWTAPANEEIPELVKQIHADYIEAGADIITTNTFRTIRYTYQDEDKARAATAKAVELAQAAVQESGKEVLVAGSISTLEDCYRPDLRPKREVLEEEHYHQADVFESLGVDFTLAETINSKDEAIAIAKAVAATSLPLMMSFVTDGAGQLLSGDALAETIVDILPADPVALLLNCRKADQIDKDLPVLQSGYDGPVGIYANGIGEPDDELGWKFEGVGDPTEAYCQRAAQWLQKGVTIIGGCCGTTPEYISALNASQHIH